MPIYEYRCTKCGHRFEVIQKVNDAHISKCEKCRGKAERLISSPAIQFKGSGWYITDYARKGQTGTSEPSSSSDKTSESSSSEGASEKTSAKKKKKDKEKAGSAK